VRGEAIHRRRGNSSGSGEQSEIISDLFHLISCGMRMPNEFGHLFAFENTPYQCYQNRFRNPFEKNQDITDL